MRRELYEAQLILSNVFVLTGLAALFIALQAFVLHVFGQPTTSLTHSVMLWAGEVSSAENSQHLSDWYSFSHIIHGFLFYALLRWLFPRMSVLQRLLIAMGIEIAWEITENTPWLINHYRQQALAQGYVGDSVINSVSDTCMMVIGFLFAARAPLWATITLALGMEIGVGYAIHDNLTLNVLGFFWRPAFIQNWQSAAN